MNNLRAIVEISEQCKLHDINVSIDESGIIFTMYRNGKVYSKHYDLDIINKIALNISLNILIDVFKEEMILSVA